MRNYFARKLVELAQSDESIVLLYGDIGNKLFDQFKAQFPNRYFNCGVAEANMVGVAAGLAKSGLKPWVYTINSFLYLKALEQIKLDVCYQQLPVTLVGTGGGLSYSELGTTHHSLEDLGVLSQMPDLGVFAPGTISALHDVMQYVHLKSKPAYLRIGKKEEFDAESERIHRTSNSVGFFEIDPFESPTSFAVLSVGTIVENVSLAVTRARNSGFSLRHIHIPQVSPVDSIALKSLFDSYSRLLVIEENYANGGLYSQLCILKSEANASTEIIRLGPSHDYFVGLGHLDEARKRLGLTPEDIHKKLIFNP